MITLSCVTFLLLLPLCHSLSFFTNLTNMTVSINLPVEFSVFVKHSSPVSLTWTHGSISVVCVSSNTQCTPTVPRYTFTMASSLDLSLFTMRIAAVNTSDAGNVVSNVTEISDGNIITSRAVLFVLDRLDFLLEPRDQMRLVGGSAYFACSGNKPGGSLMWKRNGTVLSNSRYTISSTPSNSSLSISQLTAVDIGDFMCEYALNSDVITSSAQLVLTDYRAPTVTAFTAIEVNTLVGPKSINCTFDGYPIPVVTWHHEGVMIPANTTQGPYAIGSVLHFDLASESDTGEYICSANNGRESAKGSVSVRVTGFLGILERWYVIMGICVLCLTVVSVGVAMVLSLLCCCYDRIRGREFEKKYEGRIREINARRMEQARAAKLRSESGNQKVQVPPASRPSTLPPVSPPGPGAHSLEKKETQYGSGVRNPDGSVAYAVAGERILIKESRPRTLATVEEVTQMKERPPTHLRLPKKAK